MATGWWAETFVSINTTLQKITTRMQGANFVTGSMATRLPYPVSTSMSGWEDPRGDMATTLPKITTAMAGKQTISGPMATTLPKITTDMHADVVDVIGVMATALPKITTAMTGKQTISGPMATTLKKLITAMTGKQTISGAMATTLKKIIPAMTGTVTVASVAQRVSGGTAGNQVASLNLNIPSDANGIVVYASQSYFSAVGTPTCKVGGVTANLVPESIINGPGANGAFSLYGWTLKNMPTGPSVAVQLTGVSGYMTLEATAFKNVGSFGTAVAAANTSALAAVSVASAVGQMVANAFATAAATLSGYNQTQRYNVGTSAFNNYAMAAGDAPGAASVAFQANLSSSDRWMGLAVPVLP